MDKIKVGILGLGTVGTGVAKVLINNHDSIAKKVGKPVELVKVLVNDTKKQRSISLPAGVLTDKPQDVLDNPNIDIIVEVMGGIDPTKDYIIKALKNGKQVVSANKDLIATSGKELFNVAKEKNSDLLFEASVAGGIPIIRPLKECLAGNKLDRVMGIINGTTNYILTKMTQEGSAFGQVLKEAQDLGYAEADPTADIEGYDAAKKIAVLASIAFGTRITFSDVYVEGVTKIAPEDIRYAKELGYVIKLLGIANNVNDQVEVRVHPAFVPKNHPLAAVNDVFNAIFVKGDAIGEAMFFGRGAGEMPTASAVVGDVITAARNITYGTTGRISCTCFEQKPIIDMANVQSEYYIRLEVTDKPGVLASITSVLGDHNVSIATVIQKNINKKDRAELILITHKIDEHSINSALDIIGNMPTIGSISNVIRVERGGE
ncbi:MAG: homoserine dehydrogenase [Defluviitaleaceae bacterium]|nr:homoserine dehydrogenase [Defluviitaleaceae bacterium]